LKNVKWIQFQELGDERGSLVAIEIGNQKEIPFDVKRVYYIYRTEEGVSRGYHAHKELKQVVFAISGSCQMVLDDGTKRSTVTLDSPTKGILIENFVWREMHNFTQDCILLVLASEHYNESDYIRSYDDFKKCNAAVISDE
jgi:dTDP-4-dehydrorhamnose 3,5-epimerase-like enzyme